MSAAFFFTFGFQTAFAAAEADLLIAYDASYSSSVGGEDNAQVNTANSIAGCNDINDRSGTGARLRICGYKQAAQYLYQTTSKGGFVGWMANYDGHMTDVVDAGNARGADLVAWVCVSTADGAAAVAQQPGRYSAFDPGQFWSAIVAHELGGHNYGCDHSGGKGDLPSAYPKSVMMHNYCNGGGSSPPYLYSNPNIWLGGVRMQGVGSTCLGGAVSGGDNAYVKSTTAQGVADSYGRVITAPNLGSVVRRWSFNQTASNAPAGTTVTDSITGTELATVQGTGATFTGSGLQIPGGASGSGAAYLQLPSGVISTYANVTIEMWAKEISAQNWARVLDFNNGTANYLTLIASKGTDLNSQRFESVLGGTFVTLDSGLPTATGALHHYAITYASTGGSSGTWTWYRDGDTAAYIDVAYALSSLPDVNNWLGRSAYAGDAFANCEYQEVRISNVAMTRDEVAANARLGPNRVAANANLTVEDAVGQSSFNAAGHWSDSLAPGAGKSYETFGYRIRTPADGTSRTFAGQSLKLNGGSFTWKGTSANTITVNDFTLAGTDDEVLNAGSGTFTLAGNLTVATAETQVRANNGAITISANVSGAGNLLCTLNTVTLSGNNPNFTGKTIVGDGRFSALQIDSEARLGANPTNFVADQLTLNRGVFYNTGNLTISNSNRGIRVGVSAAIFNVAPATTLTLAVPLSSPASGDTLQTGAIYPNPASGMFIKDNSGTLSLTHPNNSHAGEILINAGTLSVDGGGRLNNGDQAMPVVDNATLAINTTAAQNIGGTISGGGALTKNNSGTLTVNGANTLSGAVTVNGGTLYANPANAANNRAFSFVSGITVNNGGTLKASGNGLFGWDGTQEHPVTVNSNGTLTCDSGADVGVGTVTLNGGTLANLGASTAYGSWRFDDATDKLLVTDNSTLSAVNVKFGNPSATVSVSAGKTLTVNGTITDGTSGGASYLTTSNSPGAVLIFSANTFSGTTTIGSGRLILTNTASLASSNIVVGAGATFDVAGLASTFTVGSGKILAGSGTNNGSVSTVSGARIYAGSDGGYGTNTFNQNLTLVSGAFLGFDLNTSAAAANDKLVVLGNLNLNSTVVRIKAPSAGSNLDPLNDYLLATVSGTLAGSVNPTAVWDVSPGNSGAFAVMVTNGNQIVLHAIAVPPSFTSGSVTPGSVGRNQNIFISASVVQGLYAVTNVTANATNIGGPAALVLVADGAGNFTNSVAASSDTALGAKTITLLATDSGNISTATNLPLTIIAASRVWNGGAANDNWSSNPNWNTSAAPGFIGDGIIFDGSTRTAPLMQTNYTATGLTFNSPAGGFTLGTTSSTLTLTGGVTNNSASAQTVNIPITMTNSPTINAASGNVTLGRALAIGTNTLTVIGASNSAVGGAISGGGSLFKSGAGALTVSSNSAWGGVGATSGGFSGPLIAQAGGVIFNGGIATVTGEVVIGGLIANGGAGNNAKIIVSNATLNLSTWMSIGRGNGVGAVSSDLVLTNAAVVTCSNLSAGYNGGSAANLPRGSLTLNNSSTFTVLGNGAVNFAESPGSDFTMTLTNTAQFIATGTAQEHLGEFGKGTVNLSGSSSLLLGIGGVNVGYRSGTGVVSVANSAVLRVPGELRVGGSDTSGAGNNGYGTVNMSGGTVTVGSLTIARGNDFQNGVAGEVNVNGGTFTCTNDVVLGYAGTGRAKLNLNGGIFNVGTTALKWLIAPFYDTTTAEINLTNGALNLNSGSFIRFSRGNTGTAGSPNVISQKGGTVTFFSDFATTVGGAGALDLQYSGAATITNIYNLDGGTLTVPQIISSLTTATRQFNFNGGTLKAATASATFFNASVASAANVRNGGAVIDTAGFNVTIGQRLTHSAIAGDAATDGGVTKRGAGTLLLSGANTFNGNTTVNGGILELSQAALATNSIVTITNGAKLQLDFATTNLVAALVLNGVTQPGGIYGSGTTPTYLAGTGKLRIVSTVATNSTNISFTVSGGNLTLTWPSDHIGWRLQSQTNSVNTGLGANWSDVPGATATNSVNFLFDPNTGSVFYRLVYP